MELSGVYSAARRMGKEYPILAIRGISDIVGFKRDSAWTKFAFNTAASLFFALLRAVPSGLLAHRRGVSQTGLLSSDTVSRIEEARPADAYSSCDHGLIEPVFGQDGEPTGEQECAICHARFADDGGPT